MRKWIMNALIAVAGLFVIIQFFPSGRPQNKPVTGKDIASVTEVPEEVGNLIRQACFDCHSQNTRFPWYSYVAPVSWLVAKDVNNGRKNLDFSKWGELSKKDKLKTLDEISEMVGEEEMPLKIYILMHSEANLKKEDRDLIVQWADETAEKVFEE
jgi:hypothetical protein